MPTTYTTITIQPSGEIDVKRDQPKPTLSLMQEAVKGDTPRGLIAPVDYACPAGVQAYVHDEGLLYGMTPNPFATLFTKYPQRLVGPCFIAFKTTSKRANKFFQEILV